MPPISKHVDASTLARTGCDRRRGRNPRSTGRIPFSWAIVGLIAITLASPVLAETIRVRGANGATGAQGRLGADGGPGGAGQDAIGSAGPSDPLNEIFLDGGGGGAGGRGAEPNGNGGAGGAGGDAIGTATTILTTGSAEARVTATGGTAGAGGQPAPGGSGIGGNGGEGGSARGSAHATTADGSASVRLRIRGGSGGTGYGVGSVGGAAGTAEAEAIIDASRGGSLSVSLTGGTGGAGLDGADAAPGADVAIQDGLTIEDGSGDDPGHYEYLDVTGGSGGFTRGTTEVTGGDAGDGGDARIVRHHEGLAADRVHIDLDAEGGRGGSVQMGGDAGRGGNAHATGFVALSDTALSGATEPAYMAVTARGGQGGSGGRVGDVGVEGGSAFAVAEMTSINTQADAVATAAAFGGSGGDTQGTGLRGGAGGGATARARATASLDALARASVSVVGGHGGRGQAGADGGDGLDVDLDDVVSGTGGRVELVQNASGGSGGDSETTFGAQSGRGGNGGDARSSLSATNDEGSLSIETSATGGSGGDAGGEAGTAYADAVGIARDDVSIEVTVRGGSAADRAGSQPIGRSGGTATLGSVSGISTEGGAVRVTANVYGGRGGAGQTQMGAGISVELDNAVDGDTTGEIFLRQVAVGGGVSLDSIPSSPGAGARGGDAVSAIDTLKRASSLRIEAVSQGGDSAGLDDTAQAHSGGNATSRVHATNDTGELEIAYRAEGGDGSRTSFSGHVNGVGGEATSIVRARTTGDGNDIWVGAANSGFGSTGGHGGGGGYTDLEAIAEGDSEVLVYSIATGGASGTLATSGGNAEAHAVGRNGGPSRVVVNARARGGNGVGGIPEADLAGRAAATAWGESTGGGEVEAEASVIGGTANAGTGADVRLIDAVGGRTTGRLHLVQNAQGGSAGARGAGNAESALTWLDDDGGALDVESHATGGSGGASGSASSSVHAIGLARVGVLATATGGEGTSSGADGGSASLGSVYGESRGGADVRVVGEAIGGDGDDTDRFSGILPAGAGGDATAIDSVRGRTDGRLELNQKAIGGDAGEGSAGSIGRNGGSATSSLSGTFVAGLLDVRLEANGGAGSGSSEGLESAGEGGAARIEGTLKNLTGGIRLDSRSYGGHGGRNSHGGRGGVGGEATLDVTAISILDGASVSLSSYTDGGSSLARFGRDSAPSGAPADASSRTTGRAHGNSRVEVSDSAAGGDGADGGSATSWAVASNQGSSSVDVASYARSGRESDPAGRLGSADSNASGRSTAGLVTVRSNATIDVANAFRSELRSSPDSIARARSTGRGGAVVVESQANSMTGRVGEAGFVVSAIARAAEASQLSSEATAGSSDVGSVFDSKAAAAVAVNGAHERDGEWARVGMNLRPLVEDLDIVLASEVNLSIGVRPDRLDGLFVSFLDAQFGADFSELVFRIEYGNAIVIDEVFFDAATAAVFFAQVLDLGSLDPGESNPYPFPFPRASDLRFTLEGTGSTLKSSFGVAFAVGTIAIPEPGTGLLIGIGLFALARLRRA